VRDRHVKFHEDRDNLLVVGGVNAYSVERSVPALPRLVLDHGLGNVTAQCFLGTKPRRSSTPNCLRRSVVGAGITSVRTRIEASRQACAASHGFEPKSQENLILRVIVPCVTGRIP
jgi:hypothetical protein